MEKTDQELYDIADRMLANLEKQYWDTQQQEICFDKECPENNEDMHEGYQMLEGEDENNHLNDSESSHENQEENEQDQQNEENKEVEDNNASCPAVPAHQQQPQQPANSEQNDMGQLMEVFPMPQWVPEEKQVNINSEKIKQFTLKMSLPVPDWVNNEEVLKNRIMELFGQKK